jgi:rhodanese-related sulfurtransferase
MKTTLRRTVELLTAGAITGTLIHISGISLQPETWRTPPSIPVSRARALAPEPLWIDVRSEERFNLRTIPNAVRADLADWNGTLRRISTSHWQGPNHTIVVFGEGPGSDAAKEVLSRLRNALATKNIYLLEGGFLAWPAE